MTCRDDSQCSSYHIGTSRISEDPGLCPVMVLVASTYKGCRILLCIMWQMPDYQGEHDSPFGITSPTADSNSALGICRNGFPGTVPGIQWIRLFISRHMSTDKYGTFDTYGYYGCCYRRSVVVPAGGSLTTWTPEVDRLG